MLRSFKDVPGWREAFRAAAKRLDEVRTGSLFAQEETLCDEPVRAFTLRDWVVLDHAQNPFLAGGELTALSAIKVVWLLHRDWAPRSWLADRRQARLIRRVLRRYRGDEDAIIAAVHAYIDDAFLDMPGRYVKSERRGISATKWPRKTFAVEFCGEIMRQFPSFRFEELMTAPLAAFWQWLHEARSQRDPEYRNYQETDAVNQRACEELNRVRREWREAVSRN